ncbi:MAG: serine hydrolase [Solirubrobacteraceae bacterium]
MPTVSALSSEPPISLSSSSQEIKSGQSIVLQGTVANPPAIGHVVLYGAAPRGAERKIATTVASTSGYFSFTQFPDRDTTYLVRLVGRPATARAAVDVDGRATINTTRTTWGEARVRIVVFHPRDLDWDGRRVYWTFASGSRNRYTQGLETRTVEVAPGVDVLSTTAPVPGGPFRWRACFYGPDADALEESRRPPDCHGQGFSGRGWAPAGGIPNHAAIARAEGYLATREGRTAIAVVDSHGRLSGVHLDEQFITGSVVKAMLLVAYLRHLDAEGQHSIDSSSNALLYPMINVSDNKAATAVWSIVGNSGLYEVAKAAGMTHFSVPTSASWGSEWGTALLTAGDQAKFFYEMDSLIPAAFRSYARTLLSTIAGSESWGIPHVARPAGFKVFFKAGWRPSPDTFLVHQIARLERGHQRFSLAIMTDGDPDMTYGIDTIQGATEALLGER